MKLSSCMFKMYLDVNFSLGVSFYSFLLFCSSDLKIMQVCVPVTKNCFMLFSSSVNFVLCFRARPISFVWTDTDVFQIFIADIQCRYRYFCITQAVSILPHEVKITTPGAILPSAKHFQTIAERHYSAYFSSGHINKENNFTSYNYFMWQNMHSCSAL